MKGKLKRQPFEAEDFYRLKEVMNPQLSPDGKTIVYTLQEVDRGKNKYSKKLWLIDVNTGSSRRFTSNPNGSDFGPQWSPDGSKIAFISNRSGTDQLWIINLCGGEAESLTDVKNGIVGFSWSPVGDKIAFISRLNEKESKKIITQQRRRKFLDDISLKRMKEEEERQEKMKSDPRVVDRTLYKTGTTFRDDRWMKVFVINLKTKKLEQITVDDYDFEALTWSKDGRFIYSFVNFTGDEDNNINTDIIQIDMGTKKIIKLTNDDDANSFPQTSPDGSWCAYHCLPGSKPSCKNTTIKILNLQGPQQIIDLTADFDREVEQFRFSPDGKNIYFTAGDQGTTYLYRIPISGGTPEKLTGDRQLILEFHFNEQDQVITFTASRPDVPADVYLYDLNSKRTRRLTAVNKKLLQKKYISQPEEVWWDSYDAQRIQGWVMKPAHFDENKKYPCIVEIHGGPHIMWGDSFWLEFQIMTSMGYVVIFCNPRGSDGYGTDFKGGIYQNWGEKDTQDILMGLESEINKGYIDSKNLFITGGSYGGFMTAWIIGHDDRFRAAVAQRGVYNLTSFYGCSDAQLLIEWEFDTFPWDNPELLWQHSPLAYVPNITTPLMIIHSELDYRAPINTAEELYTALKKLKREVLFVRYPREGHELSRSGEPKHRVDRLNRIVGWFNDHLDEHINR